MKNIGIEAVMARMTYVVRIRIIDGAPFACFLSDYIVYA
jgi:hypothetical protein